MRKSINPNYMQLNTQPTTEQPSQTNAHRMVIDLMNVQAETLREKTVSASQSAEVEAQCKAIRDSLTPQPAEKLSKSGATEDADHTTRAVILRARAYPRK